MSTIIGYIRDLFAQIDAALFGFFEDIVVNLFKIAYADFFSEGIINEVLDRVYVILGLFLLFKLTFSLINYIINPEMLTDKEKGVGKIITRIVISMSLLILTPSIFKYAKEAQYYIVDIIPRVILGKNFSTSSDQSVAKEGGMISDQSLENIARNISFNSFLVVFDYNEDCPANYVDGVLGDNTIYKGDALSYQNGSVLNLISDVDSATKSVSAVCSDDDDDKYKYDYTIIIGSALAIFLIYTMIGITIDVGIRTIKLGILQLLAPIPIISYIDPKSSKDGSFQNWVKACITTYVDLFIRIGVVYLIIFLVQQVFNGAVLPNSTLLVRICIIISLFFFLKKAPKFITDVLGLKGDGANIFGEIFTRPLQAAAFGAGVAGTAASIGAGVYQGAISDWNSGHRGRAIARGLFAPITAPFNGGLSRAISGGVRGIGGLYNTSSADYRFGDLTHPSNTIRDSWSNSYRGTNSRPTEVASQMESIDKDIDSIVDRSNHHFNFRGRRDLTIRDLKRMAESANTATDRLEIENEIRRQRDYARSHIDASFNADQRRALEQLTSSAARISGRSIRSINDVHDAAETARLRGMNDRYRRRPPSGGGGGGGSGGGGRS